MGKPGLAGTPAVPIRARIAVLALGAVTLVLAAAVIPLAVLSRQASPAEPLAGAAAFEVVGLVVARRQPRNPMGWLLAGFGALLPLTLDGGYYAVLVYRLGYRLPFGPVAVLLDVAWAVAFMLLPLSILLFPDGRLPSRRWRRILGAYLAVSVAFVIALSWASADSLGSRGPIDATGGVAVIDHLRGWVAVVQVVALLVFVPFWLSFVTRQVQAWRHADGERRQQLKWLVSGAAICIIALAFPAAGAAVDPHAPAALIGASSLLYGLMVALPVCIGVGILKYRLYEIDRIISRTLAYAIVTGLLIGVYAGLVLLATQVLTITSPVAVAGSTLAAAALFSPLRQRVQRIVDRRFNRARYDAEKTIAGFAAQLKDATDPDAVRTDLLAVVRSALEPAHASVWTRRP